MKDSVFTITENRKIAKDVFLMQLSGDTSAVTNPGQFVEIALPEFFLRRPISVCDCENGRLTLIYKVVGNGTELLATLKEGCKLKIMTGLGNGFDLSFSGDKPLILGGGIGSAPLFWLTRELIRSGKKPVVLLGFNTASDVFFEKEFQTLGCEVRVSTVDGSCGEKGLVTDIVPENYSYFYCCGPKPMLKGVNKTCSGSGQFSFEERMGCGFGACMGCSMMTVNGPKRVCKDGPVFGREELIWED